MANVPHDTAATASVLTLHRVWRLLAIPRLNGGGMLHSLRSLHEQLHTALR